LTTDNIQECDRSDAQRKLQMELLATQAAATSTIS